MIHNMNAQARKNFLNLSFVQASHLVCQALSDYKAGGGLQVMILPHRITRLCSP